MGGGALRGFFDADWRTRTQFLSHESSTTIKYRLLCQGLRVSESEEREENGDGEGSGRKLSTASMRHNIGSHS